MKKLAFVLLVGVASCAPIRETTTTNTVRGVSVRDTVEVHTVVVAKDSSTAVLREKHVDGGTDAPTDIVLIGTTGTGVHVSVNKRTNVATVIVPADTVYITDVDTVTVETVITTTQTETRVGDTFFQNLSDYAVGGGVAIVLIVAVYLVYNTVKR